MIIKSIAFLIAILLLQHYGRAPAPHEEQPTTVISHPDEITITPTTTSISKPHQEQPTMVTSHPGEITATTTSILEQTEQTIEKSEMLGHSRENPALNCHEILEDHSDSLTGEYWINPLKGNPKYQPFIAICKFPSGSTCIYPKVRTDSEPIDMASSLSEIWLRTVGVEFSYNINHHQLQVLQRTSDFCQQNITIHCLNVVAFYDDAEDTLGNSVKFLSWDGLQLTLKGPSTLQFDAYKDGCEKMNGNWSQTDLFYKTTRCSRLPIEDIAITDVGKPMVQLVYSEIGVACFT